MLLTYQELIALAGLASVGYCISLATYRLYFSPLAKFPGPKLAALTLWYEFYYDVVKRGRYTWKIAEMHEKYGPIIRINPYEIHINDPDYYDEVYAGSHRRTLKYEWSTRGWGIPTATFGTESHELHRARRAAVSPFFSKASVYQLEPVVQSVVDKLTARLRSLQGTGNVINLVHVFSALTADVIVQYAFAKPYGFVESPDWAAGWHAAVMDASETWHVFKQFPWMEPTVRKIPPKWVEKMNPQMGSLFGLLQLLRQQVLGAKEELEMGRKPEGQKTIFYELLTSEQLNPQDKSVERLEAEGVSVVTAGSLTVAHTLTVITYHVLQDKKILEKLQRELRSLMPKAESKAKWNQLEQLPYLTAIILEGLRWGHGVTHRLQRISPDIPVQYGDWTIPRGTPISMSAPLVHNSPTIFPSPHSFTPERWLQTSSSELRKYIVAFSKGTRQCLGMNLAYCELYITLAAVFAPGRFQFELFETGDADLEIRHDFFNAGFPVESKGVRAVIK